MKIEIRKMKDSGLVQITTLDERWYQRVNKDTGQPLDNAFYPSVTWIAGYYPKGIGFYKWLADKGWDEAESIKIEAGNKGSRVHKAIEELCKGKTVKMDDKYYNDLTKTDEELTVEEWEALMSFSAWHKEVKPKILSTEFAVYNNIPFRYAGTVDLLCEIDDKIVLIDLKTSQSIWPSFILQLSAYKKALENQKKKIDQLAILQVGYKKNRKGFKFNEIEYDFELFEAAYKFWEQENKNVSPKQKDYPLSLKLINE